MRKTLPGVSRACAAHRCSATVVSVAPVTAQADVLDPVGDVVEGIIGEPVPTGWLYDGTATTMSEVRAAIGADALWARATPVGAWGPRWSTPAWSRSTG